MKYLVERMDTIVGEEDIRFTASDRVVKEVKELLEEMGSTPDACIEELRIIRNFVVLQLANILSNSRDDVKKSIKINNYMSIMTYVLDERIARMGGEV